MREFIYLRLDAMKGATGIFDATRRALVFVGFKKLRFDNIIAVCGEKSRCICETLVALVIFKLYELYFSTVPYFTLLSSTIA